MKGSVTCDMGETVECSVTAFQLGFNPFIALIIAILTVIGGYVLFRIVKIYLDAYEVDIKRELGLE